MGGAITTSGEQTSVQFANWCEVELNANLILLAQCISCFSSLPCYNTLLTKLLTSIALALLDDHLMPMCLMTVNLLMYSLVSFSQAGIHVILSH